MKFHLNVVAALFASAWFVISGSVAGAAPCLIVTLTGTHGGPQQPFNGQASAGTLVRYGDNTDGCSAVKLQFDAGRGTTNAPVATRNWD
jgi:ribonuclease Z